MPAPVNASAFFPPSMPNFWNPASAAFLHQQQMQNVAMYASSQQGPPISSPLPLFSPTPSAFPPLLPHSHHPLPPLHPLSPPANPSPTFPSSVPTPSPPAGMGPGDTTEGIGTLVWLSSKAGLIKAEKDTVSFQLKDFCDQAVSDLTSVLRPGFTLQYWATSAAMDGCGGSWLATFVRPLPPKYPNRDSRNIEADLEAPPGVETGPPQLPKDPYILDLEKEAIPMLLGIFQRNAITFCPLSSFHMQISNCGDDNLYRYVGTSSLKRRQFLERRTHFFHISQSDTVSLQPPALYTTVHTLAAYLLKHGGACLLQELFDHFNGCPEIPLEAREMIGEGKTKFLKFLENHPWIFAVFPSRVFVAVRRQLPEFDYPGYMNENFGDEDTSGFGLARSGSGERAGSGNCSWGPNGVPELEPPPKRGPFGSNPSLPSVSDTHSHGGGMPNGNHSHPTPTHSLTPSTPWSPSGSSVRSPFDDPPPSIDFPHPNRAFYVGSQSLNNQFSHPPPPTSNAMTMGGPGNFMDYTRKTRGFTSVPTPPMKRFVDIEIQTEHSYIDFERRMNKRVGSSVEVGVQTSPEKSTVACGEGESELREEESVSLFSSPSTGASASSGASGHSSDDCVELETEIPGIFGLNDFGFNPMTTDSPISTALTAGIMKHLNLGD